LLSLVVVWVLNALALLLVAYLVPGFTLRSFGTALLAALVIGLVNSILWPALMLLSLPLTVMTLGLFVFVINAALLKLSAAVVPDFTIDGWVPALLGALVLAILNTFLPSLVTL
jgi:putative membrane protein